MKNYNQYFSEIKDYLKIESTLEKSCHMINMKTYFSKSSHIKKKNWDTGKNAKEKSFRNQHSLQ